MKRLLALVVALALVGVSLYVRNQRDDDPDGQGPGPAAPTRLVCATELGAVCEGIDGAEVTVEDAGTTFDRLTAEADAGLDAWLVFDPWPALVDAERQRVTLEPLFPDTTALARSRLAAVGPADLGPCNWRCLGDRSIAGELTLGLPEPADGLGLLVVGAASAGWFERADFATNDFDQAFEDWLAALVAGVRVEPAPVERLLQSRAFFDVALTTDQDAKRRFDGAAPERREGLALLYPEPVASVDVVLAGTAGSLRDPLATGLTQAGWHAPGSDPTGLPEPGVLLALRDRL